MEQQDELVELQPNQNDINIDEFRERYPRTFQNFNRLKAARDLSVSGLSKLKTAGSYGVSGIKTAGSYGVSGIKTAGSYGVAAASQVYNFTQPYIKEYYKDESFGSYQKWFLFIFILIVILFIVLAIVYYIKMLNSSKIVNKNKDKNNKIVNNLIIPAN